MSKRKWYHGNEIMAYIMPLDKESLIKIDSVRFHTIATNPLKYTCRFIYDTDVNKSFKERMKTASSKCKICLIFGEDEANMRSVVIKNLENGKQVCSTYEGILSNILAII